MASSSGQGPSLETIVSQCFVKAANIVLAARIPAQHTSGNAESVEASKRKQNQWFNLDVPEDAGAQPTLQRWRKDVGLPMVLEVFLQPWGTRDMIPGGEQQAQVETLLERWVFHYLPMLPESPTQLSRSQLMRLNPSSVYKRLVIMLRSLYSYLRLLPAYRMFRACKRQRSNNFSMAYRIHSTLPGRNTAGGGPEAAGRRLQSYVFTPVDTPYGQFRMSVDYQPASTVTILEQTTSPPPLPQIIADYVGSPAAQAAGGRGRATRPALRQAVSASVVGAGATSAANVQLAAASPPGSAALARAASGTGSATPPVRRSWSTTMRGLSPNRLGSLLPEAQSPSPPSPYAHAASSAVPYGSAPQHGALHGPGITRSLSTASRAMANSPSGKPPLPRLPRTSSGGAGGQPCSSRAAGGDAGAAGGAGALAEPPAPGGGARQTSAPVCIPPRSTGCVQGRRLRSSGDLWAMQQAANMHKPLSAPAVSHMRRGSPDGELGGTGSCMQPQMPGSASPGGGELVPPTPLPVIPGTMESESSGSNASSLFPTSCSPQLPFAFTPSAQSAYSFGRGGASPFSESAFRLDRTSPRHHRAASAATTVAATAQAQAQAQAQPPGSPMALAPEGAAGASTPAAGTRASECPTPVTGREVSTSVALMRRPSWAHRSSTFQPDSGPAGGVGYSISPLADATLESLLAGSTPRRFCSAGMLAAGTPPLGARVAVGRAASGGSGMGPGTSQPHLLTYPTSSGDMGLMALDEGDGLPFALDGDGTSPKLRLLGPDPPPASQPEPVGSPHAAAVTPLPPTGPADPSSDAAVGAFVRLLQDAPPLRGAVSSRPASAGSTGMAHQASQLDNTFQPQLTLQTGLAELDRLRQRLQDRGVLPAPVQA